MARSSRPGGGGRRVLLLLVLAGLLLVVLGTGLLVAGLNHGGSAERVLGIVGLVLGLAALRAAHWIHKVRALTRVGEDLRVGREE